MPTRSNRSTASTRRDSKHKTRHRKGFTPDGPRARSGAIHPRDILRHLHLSPRQSMGQHFLISEDILSLLIAKAGVTPGQVVLEIGPGLGALTRALRAAGARVVAVEKDRGLASFLQKQFESDGEVDIISSDILEWDLGLFPGNSTERRVIANLPYNISVPILFHLLESPVRFQDLFLMVQTEVAERMMARPGTAAYGVLTLGVKRLAEVERIFDIPPEAFYPPPKVQSTVVRVVPLEGYADSPGDPRTFRLLLNAAFGRRRKTLRNALAATPFDRSCLESALETAGIDGGRRGETLSLEEFCRLSRAVGAFEGAPGSKEAPPFSVDTP